MAILNEQSDVVVWGGGTGGVAAALQAARGGASTLLLTPGACLGGMVSAAGVCCPDGNELSPWQTGLWGALLRELQRREPGGLDHNWVSCFGFRPATAEAILREWCSAEPRLRWWPSTSLTAIERRGSRIQGLELLHGEQAIRVDLRILIDGSDRGDTFPLADVPYRIGWEPQELWGEPSAPSQQRLDSETFFRDQPVQSPTWVVMGQLEGEPVLSSPEIAISASTRLAAPFESALETFGLQRTISYGRLPGGLVMLNWPLHGNDWHQGLHRAFSSDRTDENELYAEMQSHSLLFVDALTEATGGWLQRGAGFSQFNGSPAPWLAVMPYWREGRRMIGQQIVIEQDLLPVGHGASIAHLPLTSSGELQSIAVGNYPNDHHYPGPDWPLAPKNCDWGGRMTGTPFCLPYGSLVSAELDNLIAADKCISVSHMANGATRLQPLILNVGQAAGAAAALCIQRSCLPVDLPVPELQHALIGDRTAPSGVVPSWDLPWHHPNWADGQLAALRDPSCLTNTGWLDCDPPRLDPTNAPTEPGERFWEGELQRSCSGGYIFRANGSSKTWPLITLEPALHHWLRSLRSPRSVGLIGCANPWGPWLRASRIVI